MRRGMCLAAAFAISVLSLHAEDNQAPKGFTALFNGKDFTGWEGGLRIDKRLKMSPADLEKAQTFENKKMKEHWKIEGGVLINDGTGQNIGANMATVKHFKNFELMVDWKINPKGDSGLYLRGIPQVQIWDSKSLGDRFKAEKDKGSGALWNNKNPAEKIPLKFADKEPGQWNQFHIVMKGDKVSVKLNDVLVVDDVVLQNIWEPGKPLPERGPIELQSHPNQESKPDSLYFKNIYIKELPD